MTMRLSRLLSAVLFGALLPTLGLAADIDIESDVRPPEHLPPGMAEAAAKDPWPIRLMMQHIKNGMFIRLPVVDTDPNRGVTYGVMPIWVVKEPKSDRIKHIHAPSLTYNDIFKVVPTYRYYLYPTEFSVLTARASASMKEDKEALVEFEDMDFLGKRIAAACKFQFNVDGSERFYGVGPDTPKDAESNYTRKTLQYFLRLGLPIYRNSGWKFNLGHHFAGEMLKDGPIDALPDLAARFPEHASERWRQDGELELFMDYDTRDGAVTATQGAYSKIFIDNAQKAFGSEYAFQRYGFDSRYFYKPAPGSRFVTAGSVRYMQLIGTAPFYLMPQLGGKYVFRAYGTGRYIDRGVLAANLEERISVYKVPVAGVVTEFEVAPFIGLGSVFTSPGHMAARYARPVIGGAVRAMARPQVVGSIDFGIGQEGLAIFMDINYPF
ncbi:MAG TPA: hypothetical protein DCM05_09000 [Elusimicrobia bacterium]|nr:hypothetical protein [Elusimicrobiota bacterium]